jgi:serine phosphatase RsbU (regulator of sigma subunit)/pSer/pThr/pTyr-binding forkhead associated (FHA) protein
MTRAATSRPEIALLIETADQRRKVVVSKSPFTIGRAKACDAAIDDVRVSRLHAQLLLEHGQHFIVDAGSRHGTFVNGTRIDRASIKNNDEITLGVCGLKLVFLEGSRANRSTRVLLRKVWSEPATSEMEKLKLFLEAARSLSSGSMIEDVLHNMLDYALRLTKAERGFVYLKQASSGPSLACGLDYTGHSLLQDANVSRSVVQEAMTSAAEFITGDATQQSALAGRPSIVMNELRTVIAIPLRVGGAAVEGVLYLDSHSISHNLSGVSQDVLRALTGECASVLEHARLLEAEQSAKQYRQEMEIAASIQRSLIAEPEVRCEFARVRGRTIPCRKVGGDVFEVLVSPQAVTAMVADVSGKGIGAALLASVIQGMFYAQISSGGGLVDSVSAINRFLCSRVAGQKYATLLAAQLRPDGALQVVNCGHIPPILAAGGVTRLRDGDLPLGFLEEASFHVIERTFPVGARLCMLTDGITESEDARGTEFGLDRVEECLCLADPVQETLAAIKNFCGDHEAQDDRTMMIVERTR